MGKPYSLDLRSRIVAYVDAGHSARAAARLFGVSASTAVRLLADRRARGGIAPRPQGRAAGTVGKLAPHRDFLIEIVRAEPDFTLKELAAALAEDRGNQVQLSSLHRALVRVGYGRFVAKCYQKGEDLNAWLVANGWAVAYRQYGWDYVSQEREAKAAKRGIWPRRFVMPWDWRRGQR